MDLSIIIRCCNDPKVIRCIESIDANVEIIVSMCPNKDILKKIKKLGIKYCIVRKGNLSITSNRGLNLAKYDKVIITDSDTYFEKGCIKKICQALDDFLVVRPKIHFKHLPKKPFSKLIANARDYVYSFPVIFTPGISFRKDILDLIGGYLFNESIPFAVDAELDYRIHQYNINYKILDSALIYHSAENLIHDLYAAYRIGKGCRVGEIIHKKKPKSIVNLKIVKASMYNDIIKRKGTSTFLYQLIWDLFFYIGWIIQKFRFINY